MQRALHLANCSWQEFFFLVYECFFQDFDFENDIVIKVGNVADLGTNCKNLKL